MIGTNNEYYERLTNTVNKEKVSSYFDDYKKNSSHMVFSIRNDVKEFLELFNEILEAEQSKNNFFYLDGDYQNSLSYSGNLKSLTLAEG